MSTPDSLVIPDWASPDDPSYDEYVKALSQGMTLRDRHQWMTYFKARDRWNEMKEGKANTITVDEWNEAVQRCNKARREAETDSVLYGSVIAGVLLILTPILLSSVEGGGRWLLALASLLAGVAVTIASRRAMLTLAVPKMIEAAGDVVARIERTLVALRFPHPETGARLALLQGYFVYEGMVYSVVPHRSGEVVLAAHPAEGYQDE